VGATSRSPEASFRVCSSKIKDIAEVIFDDEIVGLKEKPDCVGVQLKYSGERQFDLVIGADGLHSTVRKLNFGAPQQSQKALGYIVPYSRPVVIGRATKMCI
jgi:2-polyprenyl-6-methoxyphenol hydroxylase-like FAD-dependent oxidoreductase